MVDAREGGDVYGSLVDLEICGVVVAEWKASSIVGRHSRDKEIRRDENDNRGK